MSDSFDFLRKHNILVKKENSIFAEICKHYNMSYADINMLDAIYDRNKITEPTVLAEELLIPKQTITSMLDKLEKKGYVKRQHTETCEKQPRERHDAIPVASCHPVFGSSSQQNQSASHGHINQCRVNKINIVLLPIAQGNACTCQKHHCLHKEQDTQDAKNHLSVNQTVASVGSYIDRRR